DKDRAGRASRPRCPINRAYEHLQRSQCDRVADRVIPEMDLGRERAQYDGVIPPQAAVVDDPEVLWEDRERRIGLPSRTTYHERTEARSRVSTVFRHAGHRGPRLWRDR